MSQRNVSLDGTRLKLERAKDHLRDFEAATQRFFQTNPYEIVVQDNTHADQRQHVVVRADPLPASLSLILGDAIHNLRSALDHLIWQLVIANGGKPNRNTGFPIWDTKAKYKAGRPGNAQGISQSALKVLYGLKPYKGGNSPLWTLHQLDITDKHRLLLAVFAAHRNVIIDFGASMRRAFADQPGQEWIQNIPDMPIALNPAERQLVGPGVVLFGAPLGDQSHDDVEFTIEVALDEPGVVQREPPLPLLQQLCSVVEATIGLFAPHIP